jgi:ABC-2 type transport system ATP-binding protein
MIEAIDLVKSYDDVQALRGISFQVDEGEIVGLLGPNGAGKTTAIKILTGYLQPDEGSVTVDGLDVLTRPLEVQARIGYLPENAPLYPELSVQAYLKMMADLRQIPPDQQVDRISEAIYATSMQDYLTRPNGHLSKGLRQRVGLAQAILHQPRLLILDEPTVGLDPTQIVEIRGLIRRLAKHSTILFSTHILSEVEALCDRAIILMNGRIRADARLSELAATSDAILVLQQAAANVEPALKKLNGVRGVEVLAATDKHPAYRVKGSEGVDLCPAVYDLARQNNWPLRELHRDVRTLESVFNQLATTAEEEFEDEDQVAEPA